MTYFTGSCGQPCIWEIQVNAQTQHQEFEALFFKTLPPLFTDFDLHKGTTLCPSCVRCWKIYKRVKKDTGRDSLVGIAFCRDFLLMLGIGNDFLHIESVPFNIYVEVILLRIVLGTLSALTQTGEQILLVVVRPPAVCCADKRTSQHIWGQILFTIFTIESSIEVWRMIIRFRDAIK